MNKKNYFQKDMDKYTKLHFNAFNKWFLDYGGYDGYGDDAHDRSHSKYDSNTRTSGYYLYICDSMYWNMQSITGMFHFGSILILRNCGLT